MEPKKDQELLNILEGENEAPIEQEISLFNIIQKALARLIDLRLDINALFVIHLLLKGLDPIRIGHPKVGSWMQNLKRRGFVSKDRDEVTLAGKLLYRMIKEDKDEELFVKVDASFDEWWKVYPATDMFEHRGKQFTGGQKKNLKKAQCKLIFERYVNEGKFTAEEIIEGTRYHMEVVKDLSIQKRDNQMRFVPNSLRYLNELVFEPYVALWRKNKNKVDLTNTMDL